MKTLKELIDKAIGEGMSKNQSEFYACQQIILNKISKSELADNVLIKGGVVMFNLSKNIRRTTSDLDFDFIRYDISIDSIKEFVRLLNKYDVDKKIKLINVSSLHQDDYKGKRVKLLVSDSTYKVKFKLDIGVHTLFEVSQQTMCFTFDENSVFLKVNPPEQIFIEKLYSLLKHKEFSTRFKDIFDMYYLINNGLLDKSLTKRCIDIFSSKHKDNSLEISNIYKTLKEIFSNPIYIENMRSSLDKWIDVSETKMFQVILDFIYSIY